ncbi:phage tail protein [Pseudomonas sp. GG8]
MINQNSQFFAILTNVGVAKQANADALGVPWKIAQMGVGDANDTDPIPSGTQTKLINERRRAPLNQLKVDPANSAIIIAEQVIPAEVGGFWIREIALYDTDGDMVAVANCAPSFKPLLTQGSGRTQVVRLNMQVSNSSNVELKIDPSVVLATRDYVDSRILEELYKLDSKQSVRVATTANIALAGLQAIDTVALVAGDRVLVKNQAVAKDNGLYIVASGVWPRALDADTSTEVTSALVVSVEQGAALADTRWQLVTDGVIILGSTALVFQDVTQGYAPINSPALVNPTANTPPRFDNTKKLVTTDWAKSRGIEFGGFFTANAALTGLVAHVGGFVHFFGSGPVSYSIPDSVANSIPAGATIRLQNWAVVNLGLVVQGTDKMQESLATASSATARAIPPDTYVDITHLGGGVWLLLGTGVFGSIAPFGFLSGTNGYQKQPSGIIIQWGQASTPSSGYGVVTLPIAFPGVNYNVSGNVISSTSNNTTLLVNLAGSPSSFQAACANGASAYALVTFNWVAIGR